MSRYLGDGKPNAHLPWRLWHLDYDEAADPTAGNIPPPFARIVSQWFVVSTTSASRRPARFC
jgi:hypothetical protein